MFGQPSVARTASITAMVMIALGVGAAFAIRGGTSTANYVDRKTEIIACTNTGGLAKYAYCNWHEPVDDAGSGSMITAIYYSVGKSPKVIGVDFTIGPSATASGATAIPGFQNIQTASGASVYTFTGAYLINSGAYLRGVTLTNPTSAHTASLMVEYITRLSKN